jgi:predicted metalloendopeptidase
VPLVARASSTVPATAGAALDPWMTKPAGLDAVRRFDERARCIETTYGEIEVLPGLKLDGALTLSENIADFGGIKAAYAGYKDWQASESL